MQDTTTPRQFVLYGCDSWSVMAEFACQTANELSSELHRHNPMMALPNSVDWGYVAALAFHGFPARILGGDGLETYLLMDAPILPFYRLDRGSLVRDLPEYWTLEQYEQAITAQIGQTPKSA